MTSGDLILLAVSFAVGVVFGVPLGRNHTPEDEAEPTARPARPTTADDIEVRLAVIAAQRPIAQADLDAQNALGEHGDNSWAVNTLMSLAEEEAELRAALARRYVERLPDDHMQVTLTPVTITDELAKIREGGR